MAELSLRLKHSQPLGKHQTVMQATLNSLVQPNTALTPEKAAHALDQLVERSEDMDYNFFSLFWWNFYSLAAMVPCDHPGQDRMAQVMVALSRLPRRYDTGILAWEELAYSGPVAAEFSDEIYPRPLEDPTEEEMDKWVNWNAFGAKLLASGMDGWVFRFARLLFEFEYEDPRVFDMEAFGEWIRVAGQWIFDHSKEAPWGGDETLLRDFFHEFNEQSGLTRARWDHWKQNLLDMERDHDEETIRVAKEIIERMETIERAAESS